MLLMPKPVQSCDIQKVKYLMERLCKEPLPALIIKEEWFDSPALKEDMTFLEAVEAGIRFYETGTMEEITKFLRLIGSIAIRQQRAEEERDCKPHGRVYAEYTTDIVLHEWMRLTVVAFYWILMEGTKAEAYAEDYLTYVKPFADAKGSVSLTTLTLAAYETLKTKSSWEEIKRAKNFLYYTWVLPFYCVGKGGKFYVTESIGESL
jgi:hypothetical protein